MEEIVMDEDNNNESQHINAVYIPPDLDTLTDEEDMNDNMNLQEFGEPIDIVGTFELHTPNDTAVLPQLCNSSTTEPEWDSSDDENLEFKRKRMLSANGRLASTVKWKKGDTSGDSSTTASGSSYGEAEDSHEERTFNVECAKEERKPLTGSITEAERQKVETFFKGLKTQVFVSNSLANLYTKYPVDAEWQLKYMGIPVVILDTGEARARDKRRIQIALAERGTCFMLWSDTIDNLSSYKVDGPSFHTMRYSCDHTMQVGFSFDAAQAAEEMWAHIECLVACPENISLSTPGKKKKKKERKVQKPPPLPPKSHISQPCCFQHITSVDREDTARYYSLQELLPAGAADETLHQFQVD
ncbi:uncharacterized protein LOC132705677 [Cylas formicarius]|uniref:uncharacterized protein LOC132705677 n=1 Tax=Cylas formicarius TaxID=197179 RepID=UPI00295864BF|nr:uncharacterized protein LOC132705677 [Cylas formicarius]